jgi:uncharacterized protein (TIGR03000 family)
MPTYGVSPDQLPWNQTGFEGYDESPQMLREVALSTPWKYELEATSLTRGRLLSGPMAAVLVFNLPEQAAVWVEGMQLPTGGQTCYFHSPALSPDKAYSYTVRADWLEDGRRVSQTTKVPVQAGQVEAIYLRSSPALIAKKKREAQALRAKSAREVPGM